MFLSISDLENNVQSELHDVESADELNQVVSDLDGVDVENNIAGNDEVIDDVNDDVNESRDDESGDDESGDDESGDDESGDDESGDDESGDDESDEETDIEDAA